MAVQQHRQNLSAEAATPNRFPSPSIWANLPMDEVLFLPGKYWHHWEDCHNIANVGHGTAATGAVAGYMAYIDTSNTVNTIATEKMKGVLRLLTDATDNDAPVITMQGNTGTSCMISDTAGDDMPLWFEARWRKSSITNNQCAMFIGLCEEARAVNDGLLVDDTGVLADIDHIGFNVAQDAGSELNFAYVKSGATDVEVMAALDTLVADTWYKSGMYYSPDAPTAKRIKIFQNQVEQSTYVTGANIAAATFPDAEELTFAAGSKNGEATAVNFDIDWFRVAQKMMET